MASGIKVENYSVGKCKCGVPAAICTSYTQRNYGRRFEGCKFYKANSDMRGCGHFKWIDEAEKKWEKDVIMEILASKKNMDKAYIDLVKRNEKQAKGLMILCIAIVCGCVLMCISKLG
ncbi:uncharacterized protein LOC141618409 [Silene latifolia]|uniref:uncharacterized protein LOC141618409 n=1 Tax=Silene latifolia TaxID=37657 RepID=UPI003D77075B